MPAKKKNIDDYVEITWDDITTDHGWKDTTDDSEVHEIRSVGWIIKETKKTITLASDISDQTEDTKIEHNRRVNIPKGVIKKMFYRTFGE